MQGVVVPLLSSVGQRTRTSRPLQCPVLATAQSIGQLLGTLARYTQSISVRPNAPLERNIVMTQKNHRPEPAPVPGRPPNPNEQPSPQTRPVEPNEVLGRHKNTGQKDHKGAR